MSPIAQDYLEKARDDLDEGRKILAIGLPKVAARCAYFAAFHAAEALIDARLKKTVKTHSGVHSEFARAAKDRSENAAPLVAFLGRAYGHKQASDYNIGKHSSMSREEAEAALEEATRFVDQVAAWLDL